MTKNMSKWEWYEENKAQYPSLAWRDFQYIWDYRETLDLDYLCGEIERGTPIEYLVGKAHWGPYELEIQQPLLIPRPETWDWVEAFLISIAPPKKVLDLGSGSGALGVALAMRYPGKCALSCVDLNPKAVEISSKNLRDLPLKALSCFESDWFSSIPLEEKFDLIMSNPPYCDQEDLAWMDVPEQEDVRALYADQGGLEPYLVILRDSRSFLHKDGVIVMEHGANQGYSIVKMLTFFGFKQWKACFDHKGMWRATSAIYDAFEAV